MERERERVTFEAGGFEVACLSRSSGLLVAKSGVEAGRRGDGVASACSHRALSFVAHFVFACLAAPGRRDTLKCSAQSPANCFFGSPLFLCHYPVAIGRRATSELECIIHVSTKIFRNFVLANVRFS